MTTEQMISLRDAIDAHLRGEKVEVRPLTRPDDSWQVSDNPLFDGLHSEYRPAPKEPLKRWAVINPHGMVHGIVWDEITAAKSYAKSMNGSLVELTETEPMRFWGTTAREGSGVVWWPSYADAVKYVNNNGGRIVEFREL